MTMRASKRIPILAVLIGFGIGAGFLSGQSKPSDAQRQIRLRFKSNFFMTPGQNDASSGKQTRPEIVLFARNGDNGLGLNAVRQLENLKKFFGIKDLTAENESGELEISAESWSEMKKTQPKASHTAMMNGQEYSIFVVPVEIDHKANIFKFRLEVYKNQSPKNTLSLKTMENVMSKEILWNFGGPLAIGFFFDENAYFVTFTIDYGWSAFGGNLGVGMIWTL
jgi:hypothetical protein